MGRFHIKNVWGDFIFLGHSAGGFLNERDKNEERIRFRKMKRDKISFCVIC
jgi:hypothetical protein